MLDTIAKKKPSTDVEIKSDIQYSVNRIAEKYDFNRNINIQEIDNLKKNGWYVSDCGEFFHIIKFTKNGEVKLSTASKQELKRWDFKSYMNDIVKRLNKKIEVSQKYDYPNKQLILSFPTHPSKTIKWICKMKANGVLIIQKQTSDKITSNESIKEDQYLWMNDYSLGYDIELHKFLADV